MVLGGAAVTVAADGTGDFKTISEAVAAAPVSSTTRFTINVKPGTYNENVEIPKNKPFIALIGTGVDYAKISANRCAKCSPSDGISTSATLAVDGPNFLLKDIAVENSAGDGSTAGQAVALRCSADCSVFYKCAIIGYQDTLYAASGKQFYRDCRIYGSVDFIFGNATAVFQSCHLYARLSGSVFTAQSKNVPTDTTGFVIQNCWLEASPENQSNVSTITADLGRPWRSFATVVVMESWLGPIIKPEGWTHMENDDGGNNVTYREYKNKGAGSDTSQRVKWRGYKVLNYPSEAIPYTVTEFLKGDTWIPQTGVPYNGGLFNNN